MREIRNVLIVAGMKSYWKMDSTVVHTAILSFLTRLQTKPSINFLLDLGYSYLYSY